MVVAWCGGDGEVGAGDGGAELGDEFFCGVGVVAETAGEITRETGLVAAPVHEFMACSAVERGAVGELRGGGQLDAVEGGPVAGVVVAVGDVGPSGGDPRVGAFVALKDGGRRRDGRCPTIDLSRVVVELLARSS